jgi:hypothetical protein
MVAVALAIGFTLVQGACAGEAAALMSEASALADQFDLAGAADRFQRASLMGCSEAVLPATYLRGLIAARAAYGQGGSDESLLPVRQAADLLGSRSGNLPGPAETARLLLGAAAAAAQTEREEMAVFLEHASAMEQVQLAAGQPTVPAVSALEIAGDLWLQVHRYDEARRAYARAEERVGRTPRVVAGLARVAARLKDTEAACREFRELMNWWGARTATPPEVIEAREYLRQPVCGAGRR